jgi:hypothetical protein
MQRLQGRLHDDLTLLRDRFAKFAVDLDFLLQDVCQTVKERPKGSFDCQIRRDVHILIQHGTPFVIDPAAGGITPWVVSGRLAQAPLEGRPQRPVSCRIGAALFAEELPVKRRRV